VLSVIGLDIFWSKFPPMSAATHFVLLLFAALLLAVVNGRAAHAADAGVATCVGIDDVQDMVALAKAELRHELKEMRKKMPTAEDVALLSADVSALRETTLVLQRSLGDVRAKLRKGHKQTEAVEVDRDKVVSLVTKLLEKHKDSTRSLGARLSHMEETIKEMSEFGQQEHGQALVSSPSGAHGRRLVSSAPVDLQDAALWMQAKNAKILFGEHGDSILRRSARQELTTDHFVIQRDLQVKGENWHLTTMLEAMENITTGDIISLCEGKACVGYGLKRVGRRVTSTPATDVGVINLGESGAASIMFYRKWTTLPESLPCMRIITSVEESSDPIISAETQIGTDVVSELRMAALTDMSFVVLYRKSEVNASSKLKVQGGVRLANIESVESGTLKYSEEMQLALRDGFGFKRGIPIRLNDKKIAVAY
jgi:hypothetical protein